MLDGKEIGVLLSDFAQQLRRKNADVPGIYFTSFHAAGTSPTLVLNQNAKVKREKAGSLSKGTRPELQKVSTQGGPAYGSVRNFVKTSNLSV